MRALSFILVTLAAGLVACGGGGKSQQSCASTADCSAGHVCDGAVCVIDGQACSSASPCSGKLSCCGGTCAEGQCCASDADCNGGYCANGACRDTPRQPCSSDADCNSGQCLATLQQCVECIASSDCPSGYGCSPQHVCTTETSCTNDQCAEQGKVCAPEQGGCRACNSSSECGRLVCDGGQCVACTSDDQCGNDRVCTNGACARGPGTACNSDADCGGLICVLNGPGKTCEPCYSDYECPQGATCVSNSCTIPGGACTADADCNVPETVCNYGACSAGCSTNGCVANDICNPNTGRCVPFSSGTTNIGEPCDHHSDCSTNVCWPIDTSPTTAIRRCGLACASHSDCPNGFVCYELGDGGTCVPASFFVDGGSYDVAPGGACSDTFQSKTCASQYCNGAADACYETCGNDADCGNVAGNNVCVLRRLVMNDKNNDGVVQESEYAFTALCEPPLAQGLAPGAICVGYGQQPTDRDHEKCQTGYCVQTPDFTRIARCAEGCCTPSDCTPDAPICKPIDVWDGLREGGPNDPEPYGFQKVCLYREFTGTRPLGASCTQNSDCASEICAQGPSGNFVCTQTCCTNSDCAGFSWSSGCRPPFYDAPTSTGEESVADPTSEFTQIVHALGRHIYPDGGVSFGVAPICFPR